MGEDGYWRVAWMFIQVSYSPRWVNPIWDSANLELSTEEAQIRERLDRIVLDQLSLLFAEAPLHHAPIVTKRSWYRSCQEAVKKLEPPKYKRVQ